MEAYYYSHLSKSHQAVYHAMKTGLTSLAPSFPVSRLEGRELSDIFFKLRLDCPEIFYAVTFRYRFYPDSANAEIIPEYLFDKGKIREHQKALEARITRLVRPAQHMTELEKELYIHDFICENIRYDKLKKPYSHEIIGPLGQGVGVCEGIAKTVKILCDKLGIWCMIAVSDANPEKNIKYRHAWNILRIGGVYYHLDATFDNTLSKSGILRHDYVNLNDARIFRDHEPLIYSAPACENGDHFYYKEKKLSFTRLEDVAKRTQQAARKNKPLLFHWRGGYLTRETLGELLETIAAAARTKDRCAKISLNYPQAVFSITFSEENLEASVTLEEANEGESCQS